MNKDNGGVWQAECLIAKDMPQNYKDHALQDLEYRVSRELWHSLQQVRNPCVVEIFEDEIDEYADIYAVYGRSGRRFKLGYRITTVEHRHIVMPSNLNYIYPSYTPYNPLSKPKPKQYNKFQKLWKRWTESVWLI